MSAGVAPGADAARSKTAVVTGASSGIGEALARRLARDRWRVLVVARRADRLEALAGELGEGVIYEAADLTDGDDVQRVAARAEREFDRLDLLVNNAGGNRRRGTFSELGYDYIREIMDQNFGSAVRMTEALLPFLRRSAPSAIVNIGSIAGRIGRPNVGPYNAAKFALNGWTESLYLEERANGVHVGLVTPGFIATEGFPQEQLVRKPHTRWMVGTADQAVDAILKAANGKPEISVPAWYGLLPRLRYGAPGLARLVLRGRGRLS
jgi:NAD(P)-dependent dehydrogenase (short-subunit alcohol dehydrogenase family)